MADLENQIAVCQLTKISKIGDHFICSFLDLVLKSNDKWRRIYHLLYPCGRLVNCYILKKQRALEYITFDEAKQKLI